MHELGIAQAALQHVLAQAERAGAARVGRIVLRIGELSGVDPDSLRFAFEAILPTSAAADAQLEIEAITAVARCRSCNLEYSPGPTALFECPHCRALGADILHGRELDLVRIDLT